MHGNYLGFGLNAWHRSWVTLIASPERRQPGRKQNLFPKSKKTKDKDIKAIAAHYVSYRGARATTARTSATVPNIIHWRRR